jgi:SAM-dependent methyltransferase
MIVKLYRKYLPKRFRDKIYPLYPHGLLDFIRTPRSLVWYYKDYKVKKEVRSQLPLFQNKSGIEIGGGTLFLSSKNWFPVYSVAKSVDGCNFSNHTVWEGSISSNLYCYDNVELGEQFIGEATSVASLTNKRYDFVISSNCLEHIANPLKAINSWLSVLKDNGHIMLILPNKQSNFDHRREYTSFSHLLEDNNNDVKEDDLTHHDEIIAYTDIKRIQEKDRKLFIERSKHNYENRCFHHHVFSKKLLIEIFHFFDLEIVYVGEDWYNIYIIGVFQDNK